MSAPIAILDFLLLMAVLGLMAWPLAVRPAVAAPPVPRPGSGVPGPAAGSRDDPAELADRIERAVADRKAALSAVACPSCGRGLDPADKFCRECGARSSAPGASAEEGEAR